jgi:hypothetical protein
MVESGDRALHSGGGILEIELEVVAAIGAVFAFHDDASGPGGGGGYSVIVGIPVDLGNFGVYDARDGGGDGARSWSVMARAR